MLFISCDGVVRILFKTHRGVKYELKLNRADLKTGEPFDQRFDLK